MALSLTAASTTLRPRAKTIVVYAAGGVGKSTFLANAVKKEGGVAILAGEDGISPLGIEVPNIPVGCDCGDGIDKMASAWDDFRNLLKELITTDHKYKFVGIDSFSSLMPHLEAWVVKTYYGGDYTKANAYMAKYAELRTEFSKILEAFKLINNKGITLLITLHAVVEEFRDPASESYKRYNLALLNANKVSLAADMYNFADAVMFGTYDVNVSADGKAKGNKRILLTEYNAAYQAKNRFGLPDKILFDYDVFKSTASKKEAAA